MAPRIRTTTTTEGPTLCFARPLTQEAADLAACGIRRVNVSLDTRDPERFTAITRSKILGSK